MQENYLAKWLNNELTPEELSEFKKTDTYASYVKIASASATLEAPNFDATKAWEENKNRRTLEQTKVIVLKPFKRFLQLAASVAIIMIASYFYLNTLDEFVSTQFAQNKEIILPDASEIILNAKSSLTYSKKNWDEERNISLQGEAYFKVAKGKKFTVSTDLGQVSVLGTQFNVQQRKGYFEVSCYEGLVEVTYQGKKIKLPAGSSFLALNNSAIKRTQQKDLNPSWVNEESSFNSIPLPYVFKELERQHNITIETKNIDTTQLFTGSFTHKDLNIALKSISVPLQIKYTLKENKVLFYAEKNK